VDELVQSVLDAWADIERQLADPDVAGDYQRSADDLAVRWREATDEAADARSVLDGSDTDPEFRAMAQEQLDAAREALPGIEEALRLAMVEPDPNDERDTIIELRAGAGGDEAALFAGELQRMYQRYAETLGYRVEPLSVDPGDVGGVRDATFAVKGDGAFSVFKYEAGTHRVQRVPATESQGRIHTSTVTVAVLPEAEDVDVAIDPNDLKVDVYRSTGPGGQSVNTTDSAVRITHVPTGLVVAMQDEKSQLQNKEKALRVLRSRLLERAQQEQQAALRAERLGQIGTGDRSEKIRTYNFPQGRVTDHRIKLTSHRLGPVLEGDLREFTDALQAEERRLKLAAGTGAPT
jgi:peptide chain release factor 1